jgi:hypothetical protein
MRLEWVPVARLADGHFFLLRSGLTLILKLVFYQEWKLSSPKHKGFDKKQALSAKQQH